MTQNGCSSAMDEDHHGGLDGVDGLRVVMNGHASSVEDGVSSADGVRRSFTDSDVSVLRIVAQYMQNLGLHNTVEMMAQESGCCLEHPVAMKFRTCVMEGDWDQAEAMLSELQTLLTTPGDVTKMRFLLLEQKYLEYLEDGQLIDALTCLRSQISSLKYNTKRVHKLTRYLMFTNRDELRRTAKWPGKGHVSRSKLMDALQVFLPHSVMVPPRRLISLLTQAVERQMDVCQYHNTQINVADYMQTANFLTDHICSKDQFPCSATQVLNYHTDEVWFCRFSPDGTKLATGSKDGVLTLWDVDMTSHHVRHCKSFEGHQRGVSFIAWSPNNVYVVVCGPDETPEAVVWNTQTYELKQRFIISGEDSLTNAAWHADNKHFVVGGTRGQFYQASIDGGDPERWEGVRVQCLATLPDKTVLAADTHHRIRAYNFEEQSERHILQEDHPIMSFTVTESGRLALLNIATQGVHMWDLATRVLVRKFQGITQGLYMIHSSFGGNNQDFLASGSEDNKIYVWHVNKEKPIAILDGHSRTANCVHWNPRLPDMIASASDDNTVRIWGPAATAIAGDVANDSICLSTGTSSVELSEPADSLMASDETTPV